MALSGLGLFSEERLFMTSLLLWEDQRRGSKDPEGVVFDGKIVYRGFKTCLLHVFDVL